MTQQKSIIRLSPGQRWISEAEPELGMGILIFHDKRSLRIDFPGGNCTRQYSLGSAPLRRVAFNPGDRVQTSDQNEFVITEIAERHGLITYMGEGLAVSEKDLAPFMAVSLPGERLLAGLADSGALFDLRREIRFGLSRYHGCQAKGFLGGQVDLIPHQFYIAGQVSRRYFPRVLLSDETGLGKTIEAGLILHRLLVLGQIQRVLIIVPDALVHQWFIELFRKFNFKFRIFDRTHCLEALNSDPDSNPFAGDQQGIISLSMIQDHPQYQNLIKAAGWDMVVMDEAHHITDVPEFYGFMETLGRNTRGLMLLSATPEQMGPDTHFSQLRLLDPDRFHDQAAYAREARGYEETAKKVRSHLAENKSVDRLVDTYGPGRVVFRNRRAAIKGFPGRNVSLKALAYRASVQADQAADLSHDPRVVYLADLAKTLKPEKILVICKSAEKARAIDQAVQTRISIDAARFDETMTLLQRDRQAAWFARDKGARLLICSEIGSEGRNFQFVRHLFLFDLPENPELLEQRIGRVDRIGQKHTIEIYVPYITGTGQEILAHWYHRGLGLLDRNINGLHAIFTRFKPRLSELIQGALETKAVDRTKLDALVQDAAAHTAATQARLDQGKHILLELNSFRPEPARQLVRAVRDMDRDPSLSLLMETLLDHYGVDMDPINDSQGDKTVRLTMDRTADEAFPSLPRGAQIATFDRETAIAREDINFFTWDHPFINQVLDFFLTRGEGMAAVAKIKDWGSPGLFLETLYLLEIPGIEDIPSALQFIRPEPIHILIDHLGEASKNLPENFFQRLLPDRPQWFMEMAPLKTDLIPDLLDKTQHLAEAEAQKMRDLALENLDRSLGLEVQRLKDLKKINPGITDKEIRAAREELDTLAGHLTRARVRLDAVRLIRTE